MTIVVHNSKSNIFFYSTHNPSMSEISSQLQNISLSRWL